MASARSGRSSIERGMPPSPTTVVRRSVGPKGLVFMVQGIG